MATDMHQVLQNGGDFDESSGPIDKWLAFLTDPNNLRPGLPNLTIHFGERGLFCFVNVTFDGSCASLRSLELGIYNVHGDYSQAVFQEADPQTRTHILSDDTFGLENPHGLRKWIFGLFRNPALEELRVEFLIPELPDLFHKLPKLKVACFSNSQLVRLPPSFYQLPALEKLVISGAPITALPPELGNLKTLNYLAFSQPCLPSVWTSLDGLTELHCSQSNFEVPGDITRLRNLKSLYLSSVASASATFLNFPLLEKLFFRANPRSSNLHSIHGNLPRVKELDINHAEMFATTLGDFTTLEKLAVNGNVKNEAALHTLTESVRRLVNLKSASVEGVGIANLDWCTSLVDLEYLDVSSNAIETIPLSLGALQKLRTIILRENPISTFPDLSPMPNVTFIDVEKTKIPMDENAFTDSQPVPEELNKLKRIFPNVEYLSQMTAPNKIT